MTASAPPAAGPERVGRATVPLRLAFLGPPGWLNSCCPPELTAAHSSLRVPVLEGTDVDRVWHDVRRFAPHVTIVFDPACLPPDDLRGLAGTTLGVLVDSGGVARSSAVGGTLDRIVSFQPALTGAHVGPQRVWRAIPPPVSDRLFGDVRPLHGRPKVMAIGRSTAHRECTLLPAKHHHDLLQVIHGVGGDALVALMREYDVGVYVPPLGEGGFGVQVGMHLAAGQLLFAQALDPTHGLERDIDYLHFESPRELVWALDRLARFPEMYQRLRIRGRMKAEGYRASRLFARIVHDLLLDVAAFGTSRVRG